MVVDAKLLRILKHEPHHYIGGTMMIPTILVKEAFGGRATPHTPPKGLGSYWHVLVKFF